MNRKDVQHIMRAWDEAYAKLLTTIFGSEREIRRAFQYWKQSPLRKRMERSLRSTPETPERKLVLHRFESVDTLTEAMQAELRKALVKIPTRGRGRESRFSEEQKRTICAQVDGLYRAGNPITKSIQTIADQYHSNPRHLWRIWKDRAKHLGPSAPHTAIGFLYKRQT